MRQIPGVRPRIVLRNGDRLGDAARGFARNFGWESAESIRRIACIKIAEVGMIERIYQVHPEVDASSSFLAAKERPWEVFRHRKVEELLAGRANIKCTWGIAQRALDRTHKRRRIDEGFATCP